jgi:pterin-4a-carbinolamine dehydratase
VHHIEFLGAIERPIERTMSAVTELDVELAHRIDAVITAT